jgi:hypothetical protein
LKDEIEKTINYIVATQLFTLFLKNFRKKPKITQNNKNPKNIFLMYLRCFGIFSKKKKEKNKKKKKTNLIFSDLIVEGR